MMKNSQKSRFSLPGGQCLIPLFFCLMMAFFALMGCGPAPDGDGIDPASITAFTVTFNPNGGNWDGDDSAKILAVVKDGAVESPEDPDQADVGFGGWYTTQFETDADISEATEWDFETPIAENTILYAYWSTDYHTVTFDANGGKFHHGQGKVDTDTLAHRIISGRHADQPQNVTKSGFALTAWYTEADAEWNFEEPIAADITLFAQWEFVPIADASATELTFRMWADGDLAAGGEEWFMFTATGATQYIHFSPDTLTEVNVELYNSSGDKLTLSRSHMYGTSGTTTYANNTGLTADEDYYIRVTPNVTSGGGTYMLGFSASTTVPYIKMPTTGVTEIPLIDKWVEGYLETTQWFKFTATANPQYIHFSTSATPWAGTATEIYGQLYSSIGETVGSQQYFWLTNNVSREVTVGEVYYFRVTPSGTYRGTYSMAIAESATRPTQALLPANAPELTLNTWADGNISTTDGKEWFKFSATADTQYIHFYAGTLNDVYVSLFNNTGAYVTTAQTNLFGVSFQTNRTVTVGETYYIRVRPYNPVGGTNGGTDRGSYKIAFAESTSRPAVTLPTTDVTDLTANTYASGNIPSSVGDQWYKFTALATSHYIHFSPDTLSNVLVEPYDATGALVANTVSTLTATARNISRTGFTEDAVYYLRVRPNTTLSGTFRIAFNSSTVSPSAVTVPTATATELSSGIWTPGTIATANGDQWFKFTATTATNDYIHFDSGSLIAGIVEFYDADGQLYGNQDTLTSASPYAYRSLTSGTVYYVRVRPSGNSGGTYKMAFNSAAAEPITTLPTTGITELSAGTWADGNIAAADGEQWFKFSATATSHYIHFSGSLAAWGGTLTSAFVRVYNAGTGAVVGTTILPGTNSYVSRTGLANGTDYLIRVTPNSGSGTYRLAYNSSTTAPTVLILPTADITDIPTVNTWVNGEIAVAGGEQWFTFTATEETQYIHFSAAQVDLGGTLIDVYVSIFDSTGTAVGTAANNLYGTGGYRYTNRTLTVGDVYYIKVRPSGNSGGTYKMAFNTSTTRPPTP